MRQAESGMSLREISGGGIVGGGSQFGFTQEERRGRALDVARGAGRSMTTHELETTTRQSEMAQRGFGIGGGEFGAGIGAARRAGVNDPEKFSTTAIGDAVAIGLEGSTVGEYLSSMTGYLESMSKGVDIDDSSLRGFAGALGSLDFFKKDPARIFDALQGLQQAFQGGGEYSQYLAYRSIQEAASENGNGPLTPAGVEIRKSMPLFGDVKLSPKDQKELGPIPDELKRVFDVHGGDMINKLIKTTMADTKHLGVQDQFLSFMSATNLKAGPALPLFMKAKKGKEISGKELEEAQKESTKTPEDMAKKNMEKLEGSVLKFKTEIDDLANKLSRAFTDVVLTFKDAVGGFDNAVKVLIAAFAGKSMLGSGGPSIALPLPGGGGSAGGKGIGFLGAAGGVVTAAVIGVEIGTAMRDQLNQWTSGEWDKSVQSFWEKAGEFFGMNLGGEKSQKKFEEKMQKQDEFGAPELISGMKKRSGGAPVQPEDVDKLVAIRENMRDLKKEKIRMEAARTGNKLEAGWQDKIELPPVEDVLDTYDRQQGIKRDGKDMTDGGVVGYQFGGPIYRQNGGIAKVQESINKAMGFGRKSGFLDSIKDAIGDDSFSDEVTKSIKRRKKQFGGPIYRADGGPVGTDTIPAWLTNGEFVVNARDTARNFSALDHANNGGLIKPAEGDTAAMMSNMAAMGDNTGAIQNLTTTLLKMANTPSSLREGPRGPAVSRFG
jgi:hypothetical protein